MSERDRSSMDRDCGQHRTDRRYRRALTGSGTEAIAAGGAVCRPFGGAPPLLPLGTGLLLLLVVPIQSATSQAIPGPTQNALAGSLVFGAKRCVACHAVNGIGGTDGPDLAELSAFRTVYDIAADLWNHLPEMAGMMRDQGIERPRISPREAGDLIAFLFAVRTSSQGRREDDGRRIFAEKRCLLCHQVGGAGGVLGPTLDHLSHFGSPIQIAAAMWNHGPAMSRAMQERGIRRPSFTGAELGSLIAFLQAQTAGLPEGAMTLLPGIATQGEQWFTEKNCVRCHSVRGQGGRIGPNLASRGRRGSLIDFAAALWNKAPAMTAAMTAANIDVPPLSSDEMADIVAYLYSINYFDEAGNPRRGRAHISNKGCLDCHSLQGQGAGAAKDLGNVRGLQSPSAVVSALWSHLVVPIEGPWPELSPADIADLSAFFQAR